MLGKFGWLYKKLDITEERPLCRISGSIIEVLIPGVQAEFSKKNDRSAWIEGFSEGEFHVNIK